MTVQLKVDGMSCGHCVNAVKQALESVEGVRSAQVDLASGSAQVEIAEAVAPQALVDAVVEEGYEARVA